MAVVVVSMDGMCFLQTRNICKYTARMYGIVCIILEVQEAKLTLKQSIQGQDPWRTVL